MNQTDESYSLKELCRAANVTERTVRYYIQEGLLPPPRGVGVFARYDYNHLLRLKLIRRLKEEYLPLAEIRKRLSDLSQTELEELAQQVEITAQYDEEEADAKSYLDNVLNKRTAPLQSYTRQEQTTRTRNPAPGAPPPPATVPPAAPAPESRAFHEQKESYDHEEEWKRVKITEGVELHYRTSNLEKQKLITQLLEYARRLFK
jgi:DNA-binding transcriptional MerR regulator